jgi:hypothetical protein
MNKRLQKLSAGAIAVIATLAFVLPMSAQARTPIRYGSILAVSADTSGVTWLWPWKGCGGSVECWSWVMSDCNPNLAGREVAVMSSIERVSDIADGVTLRRLQVRSPAGLSAGRVVVEFFSRGCRFVPATTEADGGHLECRSECVDITIPARAHWMTVTSKPGNVNIEWDLD